MKHIVVKVKPGAKEEIVRETSVGKYDISLREKAEGGAANQRLIRIMEELFPGEAISMEKGGKSRSKIFRIGIINKKK